MATLRRAEAENAKNHGYFLQYAHNVTSQCGEDGILQEVRRAYLHSFAMLCEDFHSRNAFAPCCGAAVTQLFRLLGVSEIPVCVDIGAWDGKHLSNTYSLLHEGTAGVRWSGVLVEANTERHSDLAKLYESRSDVVCLNTLVSFEGDSSLDSILRDAGVRTEFDLLSIDVDGNDYHLWDSIQHFAPRVVVIEFNPTIPNHIVFIQAKNMDIHHGSSLAALVELGASKGYELVAATMFNGIFVHKSEMHKLPQFDRSVQALHVPTMTTDMFQLYDGTLMFHGCKKLLWHRVTSCQAFGASDVALYGI
jgi:hypothetical protein